MIDILIDACLMLSLIVCLLGLIVFVWLIIEIMRL